MVNIMFWKIPFLVALLFNIPQLRIFPYVIFSFIDTKSVCINVNFPLFKIFVSLPVLVSGSIALYKKSEVRISLHIFFRLWHLLQEYNPTKYRALTLLINLMWF